MRLSNPPATVSAAISYRIVQEEHAFTSWDGSRLFYRCWHPGEVRNKALILFHGGHEHSDRFQDLVEQLAFDDVSIFAWDARGHGLSPGPRGYARHFMDLVRDAEAFARHISTAFHIPLENMALLGHSVGSVIAASWLHDYAPPVRGAVLGSPAFDVKLYVPLALPCLRLLERVRPDAYVNSYVRPGMLTHDADEAEARRQDPLISPKIAVRVLTSLYSTAHRVIRGAESIRTPILLLSAGADWVVHRKAQKTFFDRLGSRDKAMEVYPGFYHEIFHEKDRDLPIARARFFLEQVFAQSPSDDRFAPAFNQERYEALRRPLPWTHPKRYFYGAVRLSLRTLGKLSAGIRLGWAAGFDSGRMLGYVYENRPRGLTPLGRRLDQIYLNSAGWRGIRERGRNLERLLAESILALQAGGRAVHVVDMAAGPGRAALNVLDRIRAARVTALCRDMDEAGLAEGRREAEARGMTNVRFERGDAFDPDGFAQLEPRPDIVIVSGLYELFSDNALILRSLRGIHRLLPEDGRLIYTNQPHHPQLELIARTLTNRDGQPWVMRPRLQAEMRQLLRQAGFEPQTMLMDDEGIFTVAVATKSGDSISA